MRSWPLLLWATSCAAPLPPPSEPPPVPTVSREEVVRALAALERSFYVHWGAVEGTPDFARLRDAHVPILREIADANGEQALTAYRVLRKLAPREPFTEAAKAILYATAFEREENFLRWGVLLKTGILPGVYGDEMMALREAGVPYLQKALSNRRTARVQGSEEAERAGRRREDRVCDYAWVLISAMVGRPMAYPEEPHLRDPRIREFDLWLDRRRDLRK
ncbi:MAG TPA: hypothetical protein VJB14_17890 [Planctomycetota bacterium]|nr:hypothetical protein [Planctomycetota bacterium]